MRLRTLAILTLLAATPAALAGDYPTKPEEQDELCRDIVATKVSSIDPKDLVWFKDHCRCIEGIGCGSPRSERFQGLVAAEQRKRDEAEAGRDAAEAAGVVEACRAYAGCLGSHPGDAGACEEQEAGLEYQCSAVRRDLEGCREAMAAIRKAPAAADCQAIRRN
jgi:hypothetical protein